MVILCEVWFHSVWWRHHTTKNDVFWSVHNVPVILRVLFFHRFGRSWVQNIGFADTFWTLLFFWIAAGNGRIWRKSKKEVFLDEQKQANMAIFVARQQLFVARPSDDFLGLNFFLIIDMSVTCLSLVTKCVRLKGKELQFFWNLMIFLKIVRFGGPNFFFLHMLPITQVFKVCSMHGMQYLSAKKHSNLFVAMNTLSNYLLRKNNFSK